MPAGDKKILVIDDDPALRMLLRDMLEDHGYRVFLAEDGQRGLKAARAELPGLILLDIMMPGLSGYEVIAEARADDRIKHIPIVFCTVKDKVSDVEKGLALGIDDYIAKPFEPLDLLRKIARIFERSG